VDSLYFGDYAREYLNALLQDPGYSGVYVLTDSNTSAQCLPKLKQEFPNVAFTPLEMPQGEKNKNIETCYRLWNQLTEYGADRSSLLLNLGGGVVTDLGGFVGATFKRGIEFVQMPTSLLAMVDAALGGKTGIDLGALKNQVGVFQTAAAVCVLTEFLDTLPERQVTNGLAEMYKHGLIASRGHWESLLELKGLPSGELIEQSARIKLEVVRSDPYEQNRRKILNFGHTLGHAIESHFLEKYPSHPYLHGEAIACGMIVEAFLSFKTCGLSPEALQEISVALSARFPQLEIQDSDLESIERYMQHDKKNSHGTIRFVLLEDIGQPIVNQQVSIDVLREGFSYYGDL